MPVVMAAPGGCRHLVDRPATPPSAGQDSGGVSSSDDPTENVVLLVFFFLLILCVCCYIGHIFRRHEEEPEQATSRANAPRRRRPQQQQQQQRPAVAKAPAPAVDVELAQEPVLECTFRTADGWEQTMCSVCQSEMADGEKVRVLTACTHSFHTTCVEQWLREHSTCPLCRAPTGAGAAKDHRRRPTT